METALQESITQQQQALIQELSGPVTAIAARCSILLENQQQLDACLTRALDALPRPDLVYIIDRQGRQISSNISSAGIDTGAAGQDLSDRPYLIRQNKCKGLALSDVYISKISHRPCLTALHPIIRDGKATACLCVDFDLDSLPSSAQAPALQSSWRQIKGDPAIRGGLFQQERVYSAMDEHIIDVIAIVQRLITRHGVFHAKLHFSSSRATLWQVDDPFSYRLHVLDEIITPSICLAYPKRDYPARAIVAADRIQPILEHFCALREADSTIYLRAASINIINGLVGLNFSCDGSHYMPADDFLAKDTNFWFGSGKSCSI